MASNGASTRQGTADSGQRSQTRRPTAASTPMSTRAYLRLVAREPLVFVGTVVLLIGILLVALSDPASGAATVRVGGGALLLGPTILAGGYTRVQHRLRDLRPDADSER